MHGPFEKLLFISWSNTPPMKASRDSGPLMSQVFSESASGPSGLRALQHHAVVPNPGVAVWNLQMRLIYTYKYIHACMHAFIHTLHCLALPCLALPCLALSCAALHGIALHCIALHCMTLHDTALHCTTLPYITLHYMTRHFHVLHYITLHSTTLHYTTLHYITLHYITLHDMT